MVSQFLLIVFYDFDYGCSLWKGDQQKGIASGIMIGQSYNEFIEEVYFYGYLVANSHLFFW